ncbi:MarR family winged helix-turn-helix transcriptional regulator [Ornithinibacillus californiensis]|uniref:MarR family winged helix-turn-helix transcriptional regulator n=1 Tax=Ornithinibacillus californiensis TaxID=161536 RepID=UPI00064DCBD5|nr:MarR family transcriptional regulator [Ornithinibacillus californiensis]
MLNQDLLHLLNQRVRYINKHLNEQLQKHGLYNAQWSIMYYLYKNGVKTQSEIMNYFLVNAPTITRTVKRMEENGWISRVAGQDKRERYIDLTDEAKKKYKEIEETVSEHEVVMLANLTTEEKETLLNLLQKLE